MNVALFASAFYPHVGGVEELVRQLAHVYMGKGVCPIVVTNRWPRTLPTYETYEGIPLYRLPLRVPEGGLKARLNYAVSHRAIRRDIRRILITHQIDLLHVQCVSANGYYALLAKEDLSLPLVITTQGERTMDAAGLYQRSAFMNRILRRLLLSADYITACSRHTLADMEQYYGQPFAQRANVIYNGIQTRDFAMGKPFRHCRPYVLAIGRLVAQKGFDILIRAFAQASIAGLDLLLAGEGPEQPALQALAASLGQQAHIHFVGRADRETAVSLFKGCMFFVLPSRQEPFGIVNLEAMAAGKAVIASCVGGVPEIVQEGHTGLLVPPNDVEALAQALTRLASDTRLRTQLETAGLTRVQDFTWPALADRYIEIYRDICWQMSGKNAHSNPISLFSRAGVFMLILLHVGVSGCWMLRRIGWATDSAWAHIAIQGGLGLTLLGLEMLLLGYIGALRPWCLCLSSLLMGLGLVSMRARFQVWRNTAFQNIRRSMRGHSRRDWILYWILWLSCVSMLAIIVLATMRAPFEGDEREYHWAAPMLWAHAGHWVISPYRLTNGPALAEMLYTFSACFGCPAAAHGTHVLFLCVLIASCVALARSVGGSAPAAAAACLACPVIDNQAPLAFNDVATAALLLAAYTALLCRKTSSRSLPASRLASMVSSRKNTILAGILFSGAVSVKPFALAALPVAVLFIACSHVALSTSGRRLRLDRTSLHNAMLFSGMVALTLCVWGLHTYHLTGHVWDSSGKYLAHHPTDPMWQTGQAAGRIPALQDIVALPAVPLITGIVGQREPYGGRTGLVLIGFVPIGLLASRKQTAAERSRLRWLLCGATVYFFLLGPIAIKTRFHIFVWCVGACVSAIGYQALSKEQANDRTNAMQANEKQPALPFRLGVTLFFVLVWAGMADAAHVLLRHLDLILK